MTHPNGHLGAVSVHCWHLREPQTQTGLHRAACSARRVPDSGNRPCVWPRLMRPVLYAFMWISSGCGASVVRHELEDPGVGLPYSETYPQFGLESTRDPRLVMIHRVGTGMIPTKSGSPRPAEYWVFEIIDDGRIVRCLYKTNLRNPTTPEMTIPTGSGRYLLTINERGFSAGFLDYPYVTDSLNIYDLLMGSVRTLRTSDFLPVRFAWNVMDLRETWTFDCHVDPRTSLVYFNSAATREDSRRAFGRVLPLVIVDPVSPRVWCVDDPPLELPPGCEKGFGSEAIFWHWSMGSSGATEPPWDEAFVLPKLLRATPQWGLDRLEPLGLDATEIIFKLDATGERFVRCDSSEWVDPPDTWPVRHWTDVR